MSSLMIEFKTNFNPVYRNMTRAQKERYLRASRAVLHFIRSKRLRGVSARDWFHHVVKLVDRAKTKEATERLEALADYLFDIAVNDEADATLGAY